MRNKLVMMMMIALVQSRQLSSFDDDYYMSTSRTEKNRFLKRIFHPDMYRLATADEFDL